MTVPGGYVAGDTLTAANMNLLPGGLESGGYAEVTANQTTITSEADVTSLTVTWTAVSARRYRTSFCLNVSAQSSVPGSGEYMRIYITDGSNTHKFESTAPDPAGTDDRVTIVGSVVETGLSGSTTRKLRAQRADGTGHAMSVLAASTYPAYILVEDIGPA